MAEDGAKKAMASGKGSIAAIVLVVVLGAAAGAVFTFKFVNVAPVVENNSAAGSDGGQASAAAETAKPGDASVRAPRADAKKGSQEDHVISLDPILVTLAGPQKSWARVELGILTIGGPKENYALLARTISEDLMSFLRTVPLSHIQTAVGLEYLREDLSEIAKLRGKGQVRDVLLRSLVVE